MNILFQFATKEELASDVFGIVDRGFTHICIIECLKFCLLNVEFVLKLTVFYFIGISKGTNELI